jgi:hypothetical protein
MGKEAEWWQSHRRGFTQKSLNSASAHVTHRKFHHVALGAMDFRLVRWLGVLISDSSYSSYLKIR